MFKVLKLVFNCGVVFTTAVLSKIDFSSGIGSQSYISIVLELSAWPELPTDIFRINVSPVLKCEGPTLFVSHHCYN